MLDNVNIFFLKMDCMIFMCVWFTMDYIFKSIDPYNSALIICDVSQLTVTYSFVKLKNLLHLMSCIYQTYRSMLNDVKSEI
jgi:hypothetical protein